MQDAMIILFWFCAALLFYIYFGYPLLVWMLGRFFPHRPQAAPYMGTFSVVIVAHNEAGRLPQKIKSILQSSGIERMKELIVASDGSTDSTIETLRSIQDDRIRVVDFKEQRGKPAVLSNVLPTCATDIIVLTDARQECHPDALQKILANFSDERVGVVSGELVFRDSQTNAVSQGIDFYWRYEKFIRKSESRFRSVPGATGALYAIRQNLLRPIPSVTLLDDVAIPMQAVAQGYRCILEDGAYVYDEPSYRSEQEALRKRRTIAGNAQLAILFPAWLLPWGNPIWLEFISHKLLRLASPFLLVGLGFSSVWLSGKQFFLVALAILGLFYGLAIMPLKSSNRIMNAARAFVSLNAVTILALCDAARGRFNVKWRKQ